MTWRTPLAAGLMAGVISAVAYAPSSRSAAPALRIQAGDGGVLGLAHTIRVEGAAASALDGGVASFYVAPGAGGVLSVAGEAPIASSGGLTPTVSLTPCPAGKILKSDGGTFGCAADLQGVTSVTGTAPITSSGGATPAIGCTTAASGVAGCVSSEAQEVSGAKTFLDGVVASTVSGRDSLTVRSMASGDLTLKSASGVLNVESKTTTLRNADAAAHTFTISIDSTGLGRNTLVVDNANAGEEPSYATDMDIAQGRLKVCGTDRILCDGSASFTTITFTPRWDDVRIDATTAKIGGVRVPDFAKFRNDGLGSVGVYAYMFDGTNADELFFSVQLPHSYDEGTDLKPHVHWSPMTAGSGNVVWGLECSTAPLNGTFPATSFSTVTTGAGGTQYKHQVASLSPDISGSGLGISSVLLCRLYRNGPSGSDTFAGDAALLEIDFHYQMDSIGSANETSK